MDREERLLQIVAQWDFPLAGGDEASLLPYVSEFLAAYGEFAYLCPDQFHLGGIESTATLARLAGLQSGQRVLDVACFLGGPARWLARHYHCRVTGLDIDPGVIAAAARITSYLGLADRVDFVQGDALLMPLPDAGYDVVWGQDAWPHRPGLIEECARVLVPGGTIAFTNSVRGERFAVRDEVYYEAYSAGEYELMLEEAGFAITLREDITDYAVACWESLRTEMEEKRDSLTAVLGDGYQTEYRALVEMIADYRIGRIGQARFVAVKKT